MSSGRYVMRGRVFQGRAFAGWDLANSGVAPVYQPAAGVAAGYRSRTFQADCRARTMQAGFRSRTAMIERVT
jgi:hypothetical protein